MHMLVVRHGQPGWVAALTPLSVDGMIVAASTTLLAESRSGRKGGALPWALLVAGSVASLAANVAVAQPTLIGRVIAAWPSFALTASYELLTRQVRRSAATNADKGEHSPRPQQALHSEAEAHVSVRGLSLVQPPPLSARSDRPTAGRDLQRQAWRWALANRAVDGSLPSGKEIAHRYGRQERWGRLVKRAGSAGELSRAGDPLHRQLEGQAHS